MQFVKQGIESTSNEGTNGIGDHVCDVTDPDAGDQRLGDLNTDTEEDTKEERIPERSMVGIPQQKGKRNEQNDIFNTFLQRTAISIDQVHKRVEVVPIVYPGE